MTKKNQHAAKNNKTNEEEEKKRARLLQSQSSWKWWLQLQLIGKPVLVLVGTQIFIIPVEMKQEKSRQLK